VTAAETWKECSTHSARATKDKRKKKEEEKKGKKDNATTVVSWFIEITFFGL